MHTRIPASSFSRVAKPKETDSDYLILAVERIDSTLEEILIKYKNGHINSFPKFEINFGIDPLMENEKEKLENIYRKAGYSISFELKKENDKYMGNVLVLIMKLSIDEWAPGGAFSLFSTINNDLLKFDFKNELS